MPSVALLHHVRKRLLLQWPAPVCQRPAPLRSSPACPCAGQRDNCQSAASKVLLHLVGEDRVVHRPWAAASRSDFRLPAPSWALMASNQAGFLRPPACPVQREEKQGISQLINSVTCFYEQLFDLSVAVSVILCRPENIFLVGWKRILWPRTSPIGIFLV
jgi:hypothetical protein